MEDFRIYFTKWWDNLDSNLKSFIISVSSIVVAVISLKLAILAFPGEDFGVIQGIVITAIGGFIVSLVKNQVKLTP